MFLKSISPTAQQSSNSSCVDLALGFAAHTGFLKMLIHRWYRMLQPSAWLSWDTKLAQICQQGLVFPRKHLFIPLSLLSTTFSERYFEQHMLTRYGAYGEKRYCRDDGCKTSRQCFRVVGIPSRVGSKRKENIWLIIWCWCHSSLNCHPLTVCALTWCPDLFFVVVFQCFIIL